MKEAAKELAERAALGCLATIASWQLQDFSLFLSSVFTGLMIIWTLVQLVKFVDTWKREIRKREQDGSKTYGD